MSRRARRSQRQGLSRIDADITIASCSRISGTPNTIQPFACNAHTRTSDYHFDPNLLTEMKPHVHHYKLDITPTPNPP